MKTKIPPPFIGLTFIIINYLSTFLFESISFQFQEIISLLILSLGFLIIVTAARLFSRYKTIISPITPEKSTSLVTEGVFGFSRNPMYLGMLLIITSSTIFFATLVGLFLIILFIVIINFLQIEPEEEMMRQLFGAEYEAYSSKVRRWI